MSKSIIPLDKPGQCYICELTNHSSGEIRTGNPAPSNGGTTIEEHHIFFGPLRGKSEHYGLKVHLCAYHHRVGPYAVHTNKAIDRGLKRTAQKAYEMKYGHNSFIQEFGKNYLDPGEWIL